MRETQRAVLRGGWRLALIAAALLLSGCVVIPQGPSQHALPGSRKSFDQFAADDAACRQYAASAVGGDAARNANDAAVGSAVAGTVLGAAAGGLLGGSSGAAVGAGIGLITGSAIGAGTAHASYYGTQAQFDGAYYQCMYSRGHKVPMAAAPARGAPHAGGPRSVPAYPPPNAPPPAYPAVPPPNAPPPNVR